MEQIAVQLPRPTARWRGSRSSAPRESSFSSVPPSEPAGLTGGIGILKGMGSRSALGARLILRFGAPHRARLPPGWRRLPRADASLLVVGSASLCVAVSERHHDVVARRDPQ